MHLTVVVVGNQLANKEKKKQNMASGMNQKSPSQYFFYNAWKNILKFNEILNVKKIKRTKKEKDTWYQILEWA